MRTERIMPMQRPWMSFCKSNHQSLYDEQIEHVFHIGTHNE